MSGRRAILFGVGALVLAAVVAALALLPPAPLALSERRAVLANVTLVDPGRGRVPGRTLRTLSVALVRRALARIFD